MNEFVFEFKSFLKSRKLWLVLTFILAFFSCQETKPKEEQPQTAVTSEEKVMRYLAPLIDNQARYSKDINIQIDSVNIVGEIVTKDSTNKSIYIGIKSDKNEEIYHRLEAFFNNKYGNVKCNSTFCAWKNQPSKNRNTEVLLMDESKEKKYPYLVLEIEEVYER